MPGYGFGYGHAFSRRRALAAGGTLPPAPSIQYGPNYGPLGPRKIIVAVWNQGDTGYCFETDNVAENLPARWAARGINTWKPGHPDSPLSGRAQQCLAAVKAAGLMMIAAPTWEPEFGARPDLAALDFRSLAIADPYWRDNWIAYQISDETDLGASPLATYMGHVANMALGGVRKPVLANFTRRVALPAASVGSASIHFFEAFNRPELAGLSIDSYEWHLDSTDANGPTAVRTGPPIWVSPWNNDNLAGWPRFTASVTGLAVHLMRAGPLSPGRSDSGQMPVQYPPIAFNAPPFSVQGLVIAPQPMSYAPGDKATGHYVATGRVDFNSNYPRGGRWQPGRSLRNEAWSGFVHGSSSLYLFPQTVGQFVVTGFIDAAAGTLTLTTAPPFFVAGALRVIAPGGAQVGWIRRDAPQLSGTPGGAGTYALDSAKTAPISTGTAGAPVTLTLATEARPWGDDTNPENLAELAAIIANLDRMQAHPTGGNLLIDPVEGGRRAFDVMRCPEIDGDAALHKQDMTLAPVRAAYTAGGVAIPDAAGALPLWEFAWPVGFEGFRVTGDDGAVYCYVRALSTGNRPTWFPGFAPLGLPARVFGPFELAGFRRVGNAAATEMTGSSGVVKAGVDDGPASWFWIDTAAISQPEGNSGSTAYAFTIRRGGDLSGTQTVTASVSAAGANPANPGDFAGGVFPGEVLSFGPGVATQTFTVNVVGDTASEQDETFAVTLSAPGGGAELVASGKDRVVGTIINDDAASLGAFVLLVNNANAAPALPGAPPNAVHLRADETSFVARGGITMRSVGSGFASNASSFASMPFHAFDNIFQGVLFELEAGSWEVGFAVITDGGSGGTVSLIDDPSGAATVRYSHTFPTSAVRANDTDGTAYASAATAVADLVNNLTYVPVTITDLGGGKGLLRINGTAPFTLLSAVSLRKV